MDKIPASDYVAIETGLASDKSSKTRHQSCSFQDNFEVFSSALENGDRTRLRLLFQIYPEEQFQILSCTNEYEQNLLHMVAISSSCSNGDRLDITDLVYRRLLPTLKKKELENIFRKSLDVSKNTPLHYAAKYKRKHLLYWYIKNNLIDGMFDENEDGMSPFHFLVSAKSKDFVSVGIDMWQWLERKQGNAPVISFTKFTPLHSAAKDGIVEMLQFLVERGGFSTKEFSMDEEDTGLYPFHYAIKYSDDSSALSLLRLKYLMDNTSPKCYNTYVQKDSPIHLAAKYGKPNILKYLLSLENSKTSDLKYRGPQLFFVPTTLNRNKQTCLHVIPNESVPEHCVECVNIILNQKHLGYSRYREDFCMKLDTFGKTALDYGAQFEAVEICQEILTLLKCDFASKWLSHDTLSLLYERVPDAMLPVFESCLTKKNILRRRQYFITGDLAPILGERKYNDVKAIQKPESYYLQKINGVDSKLRNKVLRNPLVERFIQQKFGIIGNFLLAGCIFQITYIIFYTGLAYIAFEKCATNKPKDTLESTTTLSKPLSNSGSTQHHCEELDISEKVVGIVVLISALMLLAKEVYQLVRSKTWQSHFKQYANWAQLLFTLITLSTTISFISTNRVHLIEYNFHRILTVCGVLLGGILSLYEFKKISQFGEFSRIFWKVAKKSALLFAYYCMLIFAFMVSFRILTPEKGDFLLPYGLVKVIAMMVGEYEFDGNFERTGSSTDYLILSKLVVFTLFIFVAAIVGLNLLIGLAVEDIQTLKADAHTEILATQLEQIYMTEKFIMSLRPFVGSKWFERILNRTNLVINSVHDHSRRFYYTTFEFQIPSDVPLHKILKT